MQVSEKLKEVIVKGMTNLKANDVTVLELKGLDGAITDYFVVCHADSSTHMEGISRSVYKEVLAFNNEKPWHEEGKNSAEWKLLDYVNVVAHIFTEEARQFYNLEGMWSDAKKTVIKEA